MAESVYNVRVTYKGPPDPDLDNFIEATGEERGGNWLGQGYDIRKGVRDQSWDFVTRGDAAVFAQKVSEVQGVRATKPKRIREQDFLPEIKNPVPARRRNGTKKRH